MGFLSSFFGHAAANAINEANKETKKHNELCYQLSDYNKELDDYLKKIGCSAVYLADWGCIDSGSISIEKRKMDTIRRKVEQYIQLGGKPQFIHDLDELDDCIEKVKYLKSKGCLDRQQEFEYQESCWVKDDIEREEKNNCEISLMLNAPLNELCDVVKSDKEVFIPYVTGEDSDDVIRIDTAKFYNDEIVQFFDYKTVSLKFTISHICIYDADKQSQMYYQRTIDGSQKVNIESMPIPAVEGWSMVDIDGLRLLLSTEMAKKIRLLYLEHNNSIATEEIILRYKATKDINELSGIEFEKVCQQLVERMGFTTETTKVSGDGGIDLVAYNSQPLLSGRYIIQCKRYTGSVGEPIIRDLYGVVMSERANKGILMTTGHFTKSAVAFADGKPIELIDGVKMHELLSSYGIKEFCEDLENEAEFIITPQEVFLNNVMIEDDYEKYENIIQELSVTNDEKKRAKFINWLIELTMGDFPEIIDFQEKLVIFKEIKKQIIEYIEGQRVEKSNLLSYLYQMTYVQLSILEGNFNEAQNMFEKIMEHKELQFSVIESIEPNFTQILYDNLAVFTWLCYTWYDLIQVALLVDDVDYKLYLTSSDLFYGLPILERGRLESTIEEFDSGIRTFGNRKYFVDKLEGFNDIETVSYNEDISLTHMFFMDNYGLDKYYQYTYEYGDSTDVAPDIHKIRLEGNKLVIDGVGEITGIRQKISRWEKFPERE